MAVRFDEALPLLVDVADAKGIALWEDGGIVLRDASGRLGVSFPSRQSSIELASSLRQALGAYALAEPVLPVAMYESLKASNPQATAVVRRSGDITWVNLVDRRIVGADWLIDLASPQTDPRRLVFGSLKGGVGRTTSLAVLAADLANHNYRVLCVDLDLEAPGLGSMLLRDNPEDDRRPKYGALDYLVEDSLGGVADDELFDFIVVSHFSSGLIHVIPAVGRVTDEHPENMISKLSRGMIEDVVAGERKSVASQIRAMIDHFIRQGEYDVVLIDARAGLSELTAGTWLALGAHKLLLFGTNQSQTFSGYRYVLAHLLSSLGVPSLESDNDWRIRLSFVQSKAAGGINGRLKFRERLHELCASIVYDAEDEPEVEWPFNFAFDEEGIDIPHNASYVNYDMNYDAFDPLSNESLLNEDLYQGSFGAFLKRAWSLLDLERA